MLERTLYTGWHKDRELLWESGGELDARDHSVDLIVHTSHPSFIYETFSFDVIAHSLCDDQFAIGPHLVDFLFEKEGLGSRIRPDGLIFTAVNNGWKMTSLIEIRTGKLGLRRKLNGFSSLLSEFRHQPDILTGMLKRGIGELYEIPDTIEIPNDDQLTVLFIHPKERSSTGIDHRQNFNIRHKQIKMIKPKKHEVFTSS